MQQEHEGLVIEKRSSMTQDEKKEPVHGVTFVRAGGRVSPGLWEAVLHIEAPWGYVGEAPNAASLCRGGDWIERRTDAEQDENEPS